MNCIIANSRDCSREGILAYLQDTWQVYAAASADALQHTLQQCSEGLLLYYIPFCNADAALLRGISKKYKRMKIIAFVDSHNAYHLRQCIHEKIAAWMSSSTPFAGISLAMHAVGHCRPYHCDEIQQLMECCRIKPGCKSLFNKKELELLHYIGQNYTTNEIAALLFSTEKTIYAIRKRMMKKTGTHSTATVLYYAIAHGYLQCHSNKKATLQVAFL